jgi:hypothetical protein
MTGVLVEKRSAVGVVGQDPGRQQPGQAPADGHGVTATRDGQATGYVEMTSRAHTILLIP